MAQQTHGPRGFTLMELMVTLAVVAILATVAYPSFQAPLQKARRSDALVALMQLQSAQARWRSEHPRYASLADLQWPASTAGGHYRLAVSEASATGFAATALATGAQANDRFCRVLRVRVMGADTLLASGPDAAAANTAEANRQCWHH